jgi:hypothetical protein
VTTLYFETDTPDGIRQPRFSKERRLEPQITVGMLTDRDGMPLMVEAFDGNKAETKTMIPVIDAFIQAHGVTSLTVLADAGMLSEDNLTQVEDTGWGFVVGGKLPDVPYAIQEWRQRNPGADPADGLTAFQPALMGVRADLRRRTIHYQYKADRARRGLRGIDEQIRKAETTAAGHAQAGLKRNRFLTLSGGVRTVNRDLEARARALAGWKAYATNLDLPAATIIGWYHQLWHVEHSFRMSKHDLKARPIYHHKEESIRAHLAVVMAALAVSKRIEQATGWTINRFVKTFRTYREITIDTDTQTITAEQPLPPDRPQPHPHTAGLNERSQVLPSALIDTVMDGHAPRAIHIAELYDASAASEPACAIASADRLGVMGAVVIADRHTHEVLHASIRPDGSFSDEWPAIYP